MVDVGLGIVDEQVVDDAWVAGEVAQQRSDGCNLVRVGRIGGVDDCGRTPASVGVIADIALQIDVQQAIGLQVVFETEACRSVTVRRLEVVTNADELVGHTNVSRSLGEQRELKLVDRLSENPAQVLTGAAGRFKTERAQSQL